MADQDLTFTIKVDAETGKAQLIGFDRQAAKVAASASASATKMTSGFKDLTAMLGKLGVAFGAFEAARGTVSFLKGSVSAALEAEEATNRLRFAVETAGESWAKVGEGLQDYLQRQQETTRFSDEEQAAALQRLILITGSYEQGVEALGPALDFAAAMHVDLSTAARLLGVALEGNVAMLSRYGIVLSEAEKETIKLGSETERADVVLGKFRSKFGGAAARDVETLSGAMAVAGNQFDEVREVLGGLLIEFSQFGDLTRGAIAPLKDLANVRQSAAGVGEALGEVLGESLASAFGEEISRISEGAAAAIRPGAEALAGGLFGAAFVPREVAAVQQVLDAYGRLRQVVVDNATLIASTRDQLSGLAAPPIPGGAVTGAAPGVSREATEAMAAAEAGYKRLAAVGFKVGTEWAELKAREDALRFAIAQGIPIVGGYAKAWNELERARTAAAGQLQPEDVAGTAFAAPLTLGAGASELEAQVEIAARAKDVALDVYATFANLPPIPLIPLVDITPQVETAVEQIWRVIRAQQELEDQQIATALAAGIASVAQESFKQVAATTGETLWDLVNAQELTAKQFINTIAHQVFSFAVAKAIENVIMGLTYTSAMNYGAAATAYANAAKISALAGAALAVGAATSGGSSGSTASGGGGGARAGTDRAGTQGGGITRPETQTTVSYTPGQGARVAAARGGDTYIIKALDTSDFHDYLSKPSSRRAVRRMSRDEARKKG